MKVSRFSVQKSFFNLHCHRFFIFQFAVLFKFTFSHLHFYICTSTSKKEKPPCKWQLSNTQSFLFNSALISDNTDNAFSVLFSSISVSNANNSVSSSHRVMFSIPSTSYVAGSSQLYYFIPSIS